MNHLEQSNESAGWHSDLPTFYNTRAGIIQSSLEEFVREYSHQQTVAWKESIPLLQKEAGEILAARKEASEYGAILEYRLPYDERKSEIPGK